MMNSESRKRNAPTQVAQADETACSYGCQQGVCTRACPCPSHRWPAPAQADETLAAVVANLRSAVAQGQQTYSVEGWFALAERLDAALNAAHVATIRAERESACANCGHVTDDVLSCWCACHRGACRICRRPEVEHRNRNGHGFIAAAAPPVSDQTEACVVCGHASGTAQPGLCPAHEYDDGPRTIRADAEQAAARALVAAADDVRFARENGLDAINKRDNRPDRMGHPTAEHFEHWLRARAEGLS